MAEQEKEESGGSKGVQPPGVKFSLSKPKVSGRRPPLPHKEKEEEEEEQGVEYVTGFDEKLGLVGKDPERRRGGVKVVPKLENSWRPEKRMKNIVMESDVTKLTEETFEMEIMAAGSKPEVHYGLTVVNRVQETTATQGFAGSARRTSFQEMEEQKLKEDLELLPEESSLERYEELPVEEFGEALLRGMGWEKGKPIGRNSKTAIAPVEYVRRQGREGLGATPVPPQENSKKYIKPGETRRGQRDLELPPSTDRHTGTSGSRRHEDHQNGHTERGMKEDRREGWESRTNHQLGSGQENGDRRASRQSDERGRSQGRRDSRREHGTSDQNQELYVSETREKRGERREGQRDGIWEEGHTKGGGAEEFDDLRDEMDVDKEGKYRSNTRRDQRKETHKYGRSWRREN